VALAALVVLVLAGRIVAPAPVHTVG